MKKHWLNNLGRRATALIMSMIMILCIFGNYVPVAASGSIGEFDITQPVDNSQISGNNAKSGVYTSNENYDNTTISEQQVSVEPVQENQQDSSSVVNDVNDNAININYNIPSDYATLQLSSDTMTMLRMYSYSDAYLGKEGSEGKRARANLWITDIPLDALNAQLEFTYPVKQFIIDMIESRDKDVNKHDQCLIDYTTINDIYRVLGYENEEQAIFSDDAYEDWERESDLVKSTKKVYMSIGSYMTEINPNAPEGATARSGLYRLQSAIDANVLNENLTVYYRQNKETGLWETLISTDLGAIASVETPSGKFYIAVAGLNYVDNDTYLMFMDEAPESYRNGIKVDKATVRLSAQWSKVTEGITEITYGYNGFPIIIIPEDKANSMDETTLLNIKYYLQMNQEFDYNQFINYEHTCIYDWTELNKAYFGFEYPYSTSNIETSSDKEDKEDTKTSEKEEKASAKEEKEENKSEKEDKTSEKKVDKKSESSIDVIKRIDSTNSVKK